MPTNDKEYMRRYQAARRAKLKANLPTDIQSYHEEKVWSAEKVKDDSLPLQLKEVKKKISFERAYTEAVNDGVPSEGRSYALWLTQSELQRLAHYRLPNWFKKKVNQL